MNVQELFARLLRFVIILLAASRVALAGTIDPSTPDAKYVEFGKQFHAVARIKIRCATKIKNSKGELVQPYQYGSTALIGANWCLTAAHVLEGSEGEPTVINDEGREFPVVKVIVHEKFKSDDMGWFDIALCRTEHDFELDFYPELYDTTDELGKAATIAGYGLHGTFHTGATRSDNKRRAGHNKIDVIERGVLICTPSVQNRFPLEFMIAPGDSGGGMYIGNKLAGINSFLATTDKKLDGSYGDEAAFTRVSLYAEWVHKQIAAHELRIQGRATLTADVTSRATPKDGPHEHDNDTNR